MILMIDNYDSFTYNLVQYFGELGADLKVFRNDKITLAEIENINPDHIVISPGPCTPNEAGISMDLVKNFMGKIPILGVCLGHQSIVQALGGKIIRGLYPVHGKTSAIYHDGKTIFKDVENPFIATRYHSLIAEAKSLPNCFDISARTDDGVIMGVRHKEYSLEGIQFHPESILTTEGKKILANFLKLSI
ncbi:aminodeoxychorismate/anthranilate synthase component II [Candidatus Oleimmundimicrobium sp.]|uniref:anthranilate synthase component II n=1 Tax=Candidatus Oleimmundimicrobium sp. TaxID=3060597 RepID=UPI002728EA61|nr:aminodeoxychorismate/anthranilate synthase component II [Candidatus Oleimmundimicrobium sp.]MDO8886648.1 aminodeoxychorismate/anthranilate synthase component II [Candidatus Oleimmundimicrobium sp.]